MISINPKSGKVSCHTTRRGPCLGKTVRLIKILFSISFLVILFSSGCYSERLVLTDNCAAGVQGNLEVDYEIVRMGGEKQGFAPTPPQFKSSGIRPTGVGFRVRGRLSNTMNWTQPEGYVEKVFNDGLFNYFNAQETNQLRADGWAYTGNLTFLTGFTFWEDRIFLAGLFGVQGSVMELDVFDKTTGERYDYLNRTTGLVGIPFGFHFEWIIADFLTPTYTLTYCHNLYQKTSRSDSTIGNNTIVSDALNPEYNQLTHQLGVRLWPGAIIPFLGPYIWIEGGYIWNKYSGNLTALGIIDLEADIKLNGPYCGFGIRF